jgi:hypothetical protein
MSIREIKVHRIAQAVVDRDAVRRWLDELGANEFEIPSPESMSDPALLIALAGKRCYMSFQMAISEGSLRFIRFNEDVPYWLPLSLRVNPGDDHDLLNRKSESRDIFEDAFQAQQRSYARLVKIWDLDEKDKNFDYKKKVTSCLRRIIGLGVCTGEVVKEGLLDLDKARHYLDKLIEVEKAKQQKKPRK